MAKQRIDQDEADIRKFDADWGKAASAHSVEAVLAFYAKNATLVWPDQPAVQGHAKIRKAWEDIIGQTQGLVLRFDPTRIDISGDRAMATDFGVVEFGQTVKKKKVMQIAKYLVVWTKEKGAWKVLYDSWSYNSAPECVRPD